MKTTKPTSKNPSFPQSLCKETIVRSFSPVLTGVCVGISVILSVYMLVMRFAHLTNGFQYDELFSAITAFPTLPFGFVWKNILLLDVNLPLYNILLFCWNRLVPFTQTNMHLFSALLGAAVLGVAWLLAPAYWSKLKKWMYVSLLACSFILVGYGAIVRTYSLSVLLTVAFSLLALRLIDSLSRGENPTGWRWLVFFAVGLLGSYSHYFCSGLFFITALVVFLYACVYKVGRAWSFFGTGVVFGLWGLWAIKTLVFFVPVGGAGGAAAATESWWFGTPVAKATFDTLLFLFGSATLFQAIFIGMLIALTLWVLTYKKALFKQADMVLPLVQIILLLAVVAVVTLKVNLWLDRYFLTLLPAILMLLCGLLNYLQKNVKLFLILWPLLLWGWVQVYWTQEYLWWPEYTGLRDAFTYLTQVRRAKKVLVDSEETGYPLEALKRMLAFYVPEDYALDIQFITKDNIAESWTNDVPILLPLCSQIHMMIFSATYQVEENKPLLLFRRDTCIFTVHQVKKER